MKKLIILMSMMLTAALSASTSLCAQSSHLQSVGDVLPSTNIALHEIPLIGKFSLVDVGTYIDDVIAKIEDNSGSPTPLYYHSDRQFNVRGLTDSTGAIKELYAYSVYGKQTVMNASGIVLTGTAEDNNYGFTGRYLDDETGLWYFRARYFSDELGRFISRDPLGYVDGYSLYNAYFAAGFMLDPSGECSFTFSNQFDEHKYKNGDTLKVKPMTYSITVNWTCSADHSPDPTTEINVTYNKVGAFDSIGIKFPIPYLNIGGGFTHEVVAVGSIDSSTANVRKLGDCTIGKIEMDVTVTWTHSADIGIGPKIKSNGIADLKISGLSFVGTVIYNKRVHRVAMYCRCCKNYSDCFGKEK